MVTVYAFKDIEVSDKEWAVVCNTFRKDAAENTANVLNMYRLQPEWRTQPLGHSTERDEYVDPRRAQYNQYWGGEFDKTVGSRPQQPNRVMDNSPPGLGMESREVSPSGGFSDFCEVGWSKPAAPKPKEPAAQQITSADIMNAILALNMAQPNNQLLNQMRTVQNGVLLPKGQNPLANNNAQQEYRRPPGM